MTPWWCLVSLAILSLSSCSPGAQSLRINAAFTARNQLYLISGNRYMILNNKREVRTSSITNLGLPYNANVKAAVNSGSTYHSHPKFFYSKGGHYLATGYNTRHLPTLIRHDIDAAASRMGTEYYFKGCEYVRRWPNQHRWLSARSRMTTRKLPCKVDAAWTEGHKMVLLKRNKIWMWTFSSVIGPLLFRDHYKVKSWKIY